MERKKRRVEIDTRHIVQANKAAAALRRNKGLMAEWSRVLASIDEDLRGMAQSLMRDIALFLAAPRVEVAYA